MTLPVFQERFSMLARTAILKVIDHRLNWIVLCGGIGPDITFLRFFIILTQSPSRYEAYVLAFSARGHRKLQYIKFVS